MTEVTADQAYIAELEAAETLQDLIDAAASAVPVSQTGTTRKLKIAEAIRTNDLDELIALQEKLELIIDRILGNQIDTEDTTLLSPEQLFDLMVEALDQKDVMRLLEIRYQMLRTRIFSHITEENRFKGVADPEHTPGEAPVPGLRKRFCREGGRAKAKLDHDRLAEKLGPERAEQIFRTEVIPEQTQTFLDENALFALVRKDPTVLEVVRECVVPGGYGTTRFQIRDTVER